MKDYAEDLKQIYEIISYWWKFCKDLYPKPMPSDETISKWVDECEARQRETEKIDKGRAWLDRRMGIIIMDFCLRKKKEREGGKVDW